MLATNYSNVRENLKAYCDKVTDENETLIITRKDNKNVVLMSQNEYNNLLENIKIIQNPKCIKKLYSILLNEEI